MEFPRPADRGRRRAVRIGESLEKRGAARAAPLESRARAAGSVKSLLEDKHKRCASGGKFRGLSRCPLKLRNEAYLICAECIRRHKEGECLYLVFTPEFEPSGPPEEGFSQLFKADRLFISERVKDEDQIISMLVFAHEIDREPSLSMAQGDDDRALVMCFTGCEAPEIVTALGLEMKDLFEYRNGSGKGHGNGHKGEGGSYNSSENRPTGPHRGKLQRTREVRAVNATVLLDDLRAQGVSLEADGERLLVDAPAGTI